MSDPTMNIDKAADQAADGLFDTVREYLRRNMQPVVDRLKALEGQTPERGEAGPPGERGETGAPGESIKGEPGERGEPGEPGPAGRDADEQAIAAAVRASLAPELPPLVKAALDASAPALVERVLELVPAPERGEVGPAGPSGAEGAAGAPGERGEKGEPGQGVDMVEVLETVIKTLPEIVAKAVGSLVDKQMAQIRVEAREAIERAIKAIPKPERGEKGEPGADGRDGLEGVPGRDALHLDILSAIDPETVYRRGIFAMHNGGLWRSFEKTSGMRGWECVVEGFQGAEIDYGDDVRTATVKLLRSSGAVSEKTFQLPSLVHRGVWRQQGYTPGDTVMKDGHLWIASGTPDAADEPGTSKMWQLAVRRGRDGRDDIRAAALSPASLRS